MRITAVVFVFSDCGHMVFLHVSGSERSQWRALLHDELSYERTREQFACASQGDSVDGMN